MPFGEIPRRTWLTVTVAKGAKPKSNPLPLGLKVEIDQGIAPVWAQAAVFFQ
jgi:hypothetical protein